jgi:hypothetical protein
MIISSTLRLLLLFSVSVCCPLLLRAQATSVPWTWVQRGQGPLGNEGRSVAVDAQGNAYVTGYFRQSLTVGATTLRTDSLDAFLLKYSPQGQVLWARQLGASRQAIGFHVAVDAVGNSYVTGLFRGTLQLGTLALTSASAGDEFLIKYSPQGTMLWAHQDSDTAPRFRFSRPLPIQPDHEMRVAVDGQGNVYTASRFWGSTQRGTASFTATGASDALLVKYTPQGEVQWARQGGGAGNDYAADLAIDATGNVVVVGGFTSDARFGAIALAAWAEPLAENYNLFVLKYDAQGTPLWGQALVSHQLHTYYFANAVGVDATGNAYVLGGFLPSFTIGSTTFSLPSASSGHVFLAKYDPQGTVQWAQMAGSAPPNTILVSGGQDLAVAPDGTTTLTGMYTQQMSFGAVSLGTPRAINQLYVARYSSQGSVVWAGRAGGGSAFPTYSGNVNGGYGVATTGTETSYVTGGFGGRADFGPFVLDSTATAQPTLFVAKLGAVTALTTRGEAPVPAPQLRVYPNPTAGALVAISLAGAPGEAHELRVLNALGQVVWRQVSAVGTTEWQLPTTGWPPGFYQIQVLGASHHWAQPLLVR